MAAEDTASTLGVVLALVSALTWTLLTLVARTLAPHFSALSLNIVRSAAGSVVLVPIALVAGNPASLAHVSLTSWFFLMVSMLAAVGIGDTAFFESAKTLGMARALTIATSYPLLASLLAVWWFDERITLAAATGGLLTLAGLLLIMSERAPIVADAQDRRRGLMLALVALVAFALSAVLLKEPLREADPVSIQMARLPITTLLLWATPWARGTGRTLWKHGRGIAGRVALLGILTAVSAATFTAGLKYAGIVLGTVLSSTAPLFALPIGFLAFGERVTWRAIMGAALAVAGIAVLNF